MHHGEELGGRPVTADPTGEDAAQHSASHAETEATGLLIQILDTPRALADPRFGPGALELLAHAFRAAFGRGEAACECLVCARRWTADRVPVGVVVLEAIGCDSAAACCGLCADCVTDPALRTRLLSTLKRDFGFEGAAVRDVLPGGWA